MTGPGPGAPEGVYRRMVDAIADTGVFMVSPDGMIVTWNEGATRLLGWSEEEAVGSDMTLYRTDEDTSRGEPRQELHHAAAVGRFESQGWRVRKDGRRFLANVVTQPILDGSGGLEGFVKVLRDLTEHLAREELVTRQRAEILELSTPVIPIWDRVLLLPVVGGLDGERAEQLMTALLQGIDDHHAVVAILDVSAVATVDTDVAAHLLQAVRGAEVMGTVSILSGLRPETAQTVVDLGIDLGAMRCRATLQDALELAFRLVAEGSSTPHG